MSKVVISNQFVGTDSGHACLDDVPVDREKRGFIKIDVDGAELDVLQSGESLLSSDRIDLLVETHSQKLECACERLLTGFGYRVRVVKNGWYRAVIPELRPTQHNRWLWATHV